MDDHRLHHFLLDSGALYSSSSQWTMTHQLLSFRILTCFSVFVFLYIAFLLILPGVREKRFISFITVTLQLLIGALLIGSLILPYWKVGEVEIDVHLQPHSRQRSQANLGVWVGLRSLNITLKYLRISNTSGPDGFVNVRSLKEIFLNERFDLGDVSEMSVELQNAYAEGLPYPIIKTLEYFSLSQGAFVWGHQFRSAGHYSNAFLWTSFAAWMLQGLLLAVVPHHYSKTGILSGIFALISNVLYMRLAPSDLNAPFPAPDGTTTFLHLHYGACFYMSIIAGLLSIFFGLVLSLLQFLRLYTLTTFLNSNIDDTVGVSCRYGGRLQQKLLSEYTGVEAVNISPASSSSNTASSSISTTSRSGNFSFLTTARSKGMTESIGSISSRISPSLSSASMGSLKNPNSSNKNIKSLDFIRARNQNKLRDKKLGKAENGIHPDASGDIFQSSMSVCSLESDPRVGGLTDDDEDPHERHVEFQERHSTTCSRIPHQPKPKIPPDLDPMHSLHRLTCEKP